MHSNCCPSPILLNWYQKCKWILWLWFYEAPMGKLGCWQAYEGYNHSCTCTCYWWSTVNPSFVSRCFAFLLLGCITILDAHAWSLSEPLKQHIVNTIHHRAGSFDILQYDVSSDATRQYRATHGEKKVPDKCPGNETRCTLIGQGNCSTSLISVSSSCWNAG